MECCHLVSVFHGSVHFRLTKEAITTDLGWKRRGRIDGAPRLRIAATSTLPETPGSSRRESYQEPQRLLQTESTNFQGLKPSTTQSDAPSTSGRGDGSGEADYTIQLTTSNEDRASLSIANAGIMLSLIGEGGEALVQRILPVEEKANDVVLRFQRGAVDVVHFRGPNLGRISALWIAPEAGTWRLEQVTVTMTPCEDTEKGLFHRFNARDVLLGDGEDTPAVELKPSQVLERNGTEDLALAESPKDYSPVKAAQESARLREESMREYASLKLFLLGSTAGMVGVGTLGLYLLNAPDLAEGFAFGGGVGLVYLFLIQRAVDQLPSGDSPNSRVLSNRKVKTPVASFALFVGIALVLTRATQASAAFNVSLPPQELLAGVLGFFTSKVAVLLAAFRSSGSENVQ